MATIAPNALYGVYAQIKPFFKTMKIGGVVGDANHGSGYHLSREALLSRGKTSDYSIQAPADKRGPSNAASGIDITFGSLEEMKTATKRLVDACRAKDPRVFPIREVIGTLDGKNVCGWNRVATGSGTRSKVGFHASRYSDSSHLWHVHVSVLRDYCDDKNHMTGMAEIIAGVPAGKLGWRRTGSTETPKPFLGPYWVNPAEVETFLWSVNHSTGEVVDKRPPGFRVYTGERIVDHGGRKWVLTTGNRRYALDFLTTKDPKQPADFKPATLYVRGDSNLHRGADANTEVIGRVKSGATVEVVSWAGVADGHKWAKTKAGAFINYGMLQAEKPAPEAPEVDPDKPAGGDARVKVRVMTFNARLYSASREDGHPWDNKKSHKPPVAGFEYRREPTKRLFAKFKPEIVGVQECDQEDVVPDLKTFMGRGAKHFMIGKVGFLYTDAWEIVEGHKHNMDNEEEADRRFVLVHFRHKASGRTVWAGVTHLGVHFPGEQAERENQARDIMAFCKREGVTHGFIMGDFNDSKMPPTQGVRNILRGPEGVKEGVFYDLRYCLTDEEMHGDSYGTHHGYKALDRDSRWLDDICTSEDVDVLEGWVVDTSATSRSYKGATDHCALVADLEV